MIKDFFKEHHNLMLNIYHTNLGGGGLRISIDNIMIYPSKEVYKHFIPDRDLESIDNLEAIIMEHIQHWWITEGQK